MIYVPVSEQELDFPVVREALNSIPGEYTLITSIEYETDEPKHNQAIVRNRTKLFQKAEHEEVICSSDSRTKHLKKDNYEVMYQFLKDNPGSGAVSLNPRSKSIVGSASHRYLACYMVWENLVKGYKFDGNYPEDSCECNRLVKHLKKQGKSFDWLEKEPGRIKKLGKYEKV